MAAPYKVCPKCKSPAPLEASFCGQCGRQYRTQFAPTGVAFPTTSSPGLISPAIAPTPVSEAPASPTPSGRGLSFAIVGMAVVVALLIFTIFHRGHPAGVGESGSHVTQASGAQAPPFAAGTGSRTPSLDSGPLANAGQGAGEQAGSDARGAPSSSAVGPDGRIHLRNGGSITPEQWEEAARKVNSSSAGHVPPMPPAPQELPR